MQVWTYMAVPSLEGQTATHTRNVNGWKNISPLRPKLTRHFSWTFDVWILQPWQCTGLNARTSFLYNIPCNTCLLIFCETSRSSCSLCPRNISAAYDASNGFEVEMRSLTRRSSMLSSSMRILFGWGLALIVPGLSIDCLKMYSDVT